MNTNFSARESRGFTRMRWGKNGRQIFVTCGTSYRRHRDHALAPVMVGPKKPSAHPRTNSARHHRTIRAQANLAY